MPPCLRGGLVLIESHEVKSPIDGVLIMKLTLSLVAACFILCSQLSPAHAFPPAPVLSTGQTLCYDSGGAVINCAGTGQDGDIKSGVAWPVPRFTDNVDGTVIDKLTGLMWAKDANVPGPEVCAPATTKNSQEAMAYAACLNTQNYLGHSDWRVPSIRELGSLTDITQSNPALPSGHPFTHVQGYYWSSNDAAGYSSITWNVNMDDGYIGHGDKSSYLSVWPVRVGDINVALAPIPKTSWWSNLPGVAWPNPRFTDNMNGSVTDNLTNLTWLKDANCFFSQTFDNALDKANTLANGLCGLSDGSEIGDWHLPNKNELWSLVDYGTYGPALPNGGYPFVNVQSFNNYWSSSAYVNYAYVNYGAWVVNLGGFNGYAGIYYANKYSNGIVWPIRGGQYWTFGDLIISTSPRFGTVSTGTRSHTHQAEIKNLSTTSKTISAITFSGDNATEFSITPGGSNPCISLAPTLAAGASCTLMLGVTPTLSGTKNASLDLTSAGIINSIPLSATAISTVYGTVTDQATGLPVSGATVTLNTGATTTTGATGAYTYGNLPAATYSVTVTQPGYQSLNRSGLVVTATTSAQADILMPTIGVFNITTTSLPWGSSGVSYRSRVMVAGGTAPYDFGDVSGSLPPGLSLDASSGLISGTPSGSGSYTFAIGVADSATGYSEKQYTLDLVSPLLITTATIPPGLQAAAYSATISSSGGKLPHNFSISSGILPNGISLDSSGVLSGTPREAGSFSITVRVTDATGRTCDKQYALPVTPAPALALDTTALPAGYTGSDYSTTLAVSGGVAPRSFSVVGTLPTGLTLDHNSGKISGTTTSAGQTNLIFTVTDNTYPTPQSVSKTLALRIWTSGVCGASNDGIFTSAPAGDLCTAGTASAVTGSGPWKWTCQGGGDRLTACSAFLQGTPDFHLPQTGQTSCWDANGTVIDCASTGQDGEIQAGASWPNPRFSDNGNQTMTDNLTKLVWSKDANAGGNQSWQGALDYIKSLNSQNWQGHHDWRLPNINELKSLVNSQQPNQSVWLATQGFGNVQQSYYWSSTTYTYDNYKYGAWIVHMEDSGYTGAINKNNGSCVWPVRGGQSGAGGTLVVPQTGQTSCWDSGGSLISCSGTGQDGDTQAGAVWPSPRFSDNGTQTVTDNLTKLIWSKDATLGSMRWQDALEYIKSLNSQNWLEHNDWRMPNHEELSSLLNRQQPYQASWLATQGFGNVRADYYWSTTSYANSPYAWFVSMSDSYSSYTDKSSGRYVWPVRGGQDWTFGDMIISTAPTFGTVRTDTPPPARQTEIKNRGASSLTITAITISGDNATEFTITTGGSNPCLSLAPTLAAGASCTLMLGVTPTTSGEKNASLDLTSAGITNSIPLLALPFPH